jgi:hypothetical protein
MCKFKILQRIIVVAGVAVFLFSVATPFIEYSYAPLVQIPERSFSKVELWSFKCSVERFGLEWHSMFELWFFDYWLGFSDTSKICAMLFVVQTLTLLTALASLIFLDKRLLAVISTIVCPISAALMIYIFMYLSQIPYFGWVNYRVGYWLTYFSEALFVINAMLKIKLDDRKTHHS